MQSPPHPGSFFEDLIEQRSDARARLPGTGVAGDEPAAAEVGPRPCEAGEFDHWRLRPPSGRAKRERRSDGERSENSANFKFD
jgi:hypothetical protein